MTIKKPAPGAIRETGYGVTSEYRNHSPIRVFLKTVITRLAVWGLLPANMAAWIIQHGGMNHD